MSSATTPRKLDKPKPTATDEEKRCKHAEAQRKYRENNTREGAREDVQATPERQTIEIAAATKAASKQGC
ncbi:hypothetical protein B0H14DRAFT_3458207 [Mycena olivaceomarginata]|nr:hypothetical protein B0H14DRAFT_3458207 [Mycena olivaceomarginata]